MKTFFKILAFLFVVCLLLLVGAYFLVTNAGFQKRMIERNLPEGSSVKHVQVSLSQLELSGLLLALPDGTRVRVAAVETRFKPFAAVFGKTIDLGVLNVDGLHIELPRARADLKSPDPVKRVPGREPQVRPSEERAHAAAKPAASENPFAVLYQLGDLEWLLNIGGIRVDGTLRDASGNDFSLSLNSGSIRPGEAGKLDLVLALSSPEALAGGLEQFRSSASISLRQKATGGFEAIQIQSNTVGFDGAGDSLLTLDQSMDLMVQGFEEKANLQFDFSLDLPRPERFVVELAETGHLKIRARAAAALDGHRARLTTAQLSASGGQVPVVNLDLKKPMILGGKQNLVGELLAVQIRNLPVAWLSPWLPEGLSIESAPLSADLTVVGAADGSLMVEGAGPLNVGPMTVSNAGVLMLEAVSLSLQPRLNIRESGDLDFELKRLSLSDPGGRILLGDVEGSLFPEAMVPELMFSGIRIKAQMDADLGRLFRQPILLGTTSVRSGAAGLELVLDGAADDPVKAQIKVRDLSGPEGALGRDGLLELGLRARSSASGEWRLSGELAMGAEPGGGDRLSFSGRVNPEAEPLTFDLELRGNRLRQAPLEALAGIFSPAEALGPEVVGAPGPSRQEHPRSGPPPVAQPQKAVPPAWAGLKGSVDGALGEFVLASGQSIRDVKLKAEISEPALRASEVSAKVPGGGTLKGTAEVLFNSSKARAYEVNSDLAFEGVNPAIFADAGTGAFPVQGLFDGVLNLRGSGNTLESALEDSNVDLRITGREGVLTAFALDERSQLGLTGAGLLGGVLNRPGITALSQTIPYFKDIRFESFALELKRGDDKRIQIPELKLIGESLQLEGSGSIAGGRFADVMKQPLSLRLGLGAKGALTQYLETLNLLSQNTSEDGFRRWSRELMITGSLAKPDTSALMGLLNDAARAALSRPSTKAEAKPAETAAAAPKAPDNGAAVPTADAPAAEPLSEKEAKRESRDERRRREVETGINVLESLLGR